MDKDGKEQLPKSLKFTLIKCRTFDNMYSGFMKGAVLWQDMEDLR